MLKKYFDFYSGLASSVVEAMQQAEIDQVEAKYDVLIQEAEKQRGRYRRPGRREGKIKKTGKFKKKVCGM